MDNLNRVVSHKIEVVAMRSRSLSLNRSAAGNCSTAHRCRIEPLEDRRLMALTVAMVKDLNAAPADSNPREFYATEERLFFLTGRSDVGNVRLWSSDGTEESTVEIVAPSGERIHDLGIHRDASSSKFYFLTERINGTPTRTVWASEGTPETTVPLITLPYITKLKAHGDLFYFTGGGEGGSGIDPWVSDGTPQGTVRVATGAFPADRSAHYSASIDGVIYFVDRDMAATGSGFREAIYRTDGTMQGTEMVVPSTDEFLSIDFRESAAMGDRLFFRGANQAAGQELWSTDGTPQGTYLVKDIAVGTQSSDLNDFKVANGLLFLIAKDELGNYKLWRSDGTESGTFALNTPMPYGGGFDGEPSFAVLDDLLYFGVRNGQRSEVWCTDGTQAGTGRLPLGDDIQIGGDLINANGTIFSTGVNSTGENVVWRTDRTAEGTLEVGQLPSRGGAASNRLRLAAVDGTVFFYSKDDQHGVELWSIKAPPGDTNFDGQVDLTDLNNVRNNFGYEGNQFPGDVTGNGVVSLEDLNAVRNQFGAGGESSLAPTRSRGARKPVGAFTSLEPIAAAALDAVADLMASERFKIAPTLKPARRVRFG
jgi:ELWxxDGT repeat protein